MFSAVGKTLVTDIVVKPSTEDKGKFVVTDDRSISARGKTTSMRLGLNSMPRDPVVQDQLSPLATAWPANQFEAQLTDTKAQGSAVRPIRPEVPRLFFGGTGKLEALTQQSTGNGPSSSSSTSLHSQADSAVDDSTTEPGIFSSEQNLAQLKGIKKDIRGDLRVADLGEREQGPSAAVAAVEEGMSAAWGKPQPKLNKKQRRAQRKEQDVVEPAVPIAVASAVALPDLAEEAAAEKPAAEAAPASEAVMVQEPQLAQQHPSSQPTLQSCATTVSFAATIPVSLSSDQVEDALPLSRVLSLPPAPRPEKAAPRRKRPSVPEPAAEAPLPESSVMQTPPPEYPSDGGTGDNMWSDWWQSNDTWSDSDIRATAARHPDISEAQLRADRLQAEKGAMEARARAAAAAAAAEVSSSSEQLLSDASWQLPRGSEEQLPRSSTDRLPTNTSQQLPRSSSERVLSSSLEQLPSSSHELMPSSSPEHLPSSSIEELPSASSGQLLSSRMHEQLPSDLPERQLPNSSSEQMPSSSTLEQLPSSSTSEQAPQDTRGVDWSLELQRALATKPRPGKGKAVKKLPQPSADLTLQRALVEKPRPRRRPRATRPASNAEAANGKKYFIVSRSYVVQLYKPVVLQQMYVLAYRGFAKLYIICIALHTVHEVLA